MQMKRLATVTAGIGRRAAFRRHCGIGHLSLGAGWGWSYLRIDGAVLTKDVHSLQTLNGPMLTLGIPF